MDNNLNRYERAMLKNLSIMKCMFLAIVILNFFLPILSPTQLGVGMFLQWIAIFIHGWGLLNGLGYLDQRVPLLQILMLRTIQVLLYLYFYKINWIPYGIVLFLDVTYLYWLFSDKARYEYIRVKMEDDYGSE